MTAQGGAMVEPRLEVASIEHITDVRAQTQREHEWYSGFERFLDIDHLMGAVATGRLVYVAPDSNTLPIYRLRTPGLEKIKPPYLLPSSRLALGAVGRLWRSELSEWGVVAPDLRLATTSLARTQEMQDALVDSGAIAVPDSTHCVGAAFDIDASGYYFFDTDTGVRPVVSPKRDRDAMAKIADHLQQRYGGNGSMDVADPSAFDERVISSLLDITQQLYKGDYLNRIVEHPDTGNQCLHLCPNPAVAAEEWRSLGRGTNHSVWMG